MDKNQSAIDSFLGKFGNDQEPEDVFENKEDIDPFATDSNDDVVEEPIEKKEKPLKFNDDPKVQKYVSKEIAKAIDAYKDSLPKEQKSEVKDEDTTSVVEAFAVIIGNDTPEKVNALKSLERALGNVDSRASQKAVERLEQLQRQSSQDDLEAERELEEGFEAVEEHYDVTFTKASRAQFAEYLERIAPKDSKGNVRDYPDFVNAYEDFAERQKRAKAPDRSRQVASRSMSGNREASEPERKMTTDEFMESLKNYQ